MKPQRIKIFTLVQALRRVQQIALVLKHGPSPNHWNEYIFCAYSNHRNDAVFIAGVPDDRENLPHGRLMRATLP